MLQLVPLGNDCLESANEATSLKNSNISKTSRQTEQDLDLN